MTGRPRRRPRPHLVTRHPHRRLGRLRGRRTGLLALLAVIGPGLLAGLSDDDPAGITTYSVLGADYGYRLLWVLGLSTLALVVFHEVAARVGVVTGKGLMRLVRERHRPWVTVLVGSALLVANLGTVCAEFAGVAAGAQVAFGASRLLSVPLAAGVVALLVLRGSFRRVEHVLLGLSAIFLAYVAAGLIAGPDWGAAARGLAVPSLPLTRRGLLDAVAAVGTTLAPWGLAFMQSYVVDKRLRPRDLRYERIDVAAGAVLTGVIGAFVIVACAATLHVTGTRIASADDAARALEPLAGAAAGALFGLGLLGAALLAAAVVPLSTAYSVAEAAGRRADLNDRLGEAPLFYGTYAAAILVAAGIVLLPGAPLIDILVLSQALNAALLLVILPVLRGLAADGAVMGAHALTPGGRRVTGAVIALVAASVVLLGVVSL